MAASGGHLVEDFEAAFQNCLSALANHEHFNTHDQEEVKTSVEQSVQKFLDVGKQLESFFLQKRYILSIHRPEQIVREDIIELKMELSRKDSLLQRHYEKQQQWQAMLNRVQGGGSIGVMPGAQQAGQHLQNTVHPGGQVGTPTSQPMPPQPPAPSQVATSQSMPPPAPNYPQGPLAYLEQTTSSIGLPERR